MQPHLGRTCLAIWLGEHNTCPMCRAKLYELPNSPPYPLQHGGYGFGFAYEVNIDPQTTNTQFVYNDFEFGNNAFTPSYGFNRMGSPQQGGSFDNLQQHRIISEMRGNRQQSSQALNQIRDIMSRRIVQEREYPMLPAIRDESRRSVGTMRRLIRSMKDWLETR
jgi:hypothetical protein